MTKQTMTAPAVDQAAKAHFLKKYLRQEPGETELVWDRLLATGMVVLIPAGKRVAHYKLAPLPKMTAPAVDQAAKAHFLKKYLRQESGETELVWDRLLATGMVVLIPAGKRVAHYKLAPLPKQEIGTMRPTKALQRAGEALFGAQWQSEISRALGVTDRTVRRWVSGENNMPDDIKPRLRALIAERIEVLRKVRSDLLD